MGLPDNLTCLLRNLHAGQEATVRTGHGKMNTLQIRKGEQAVYCQAYMTGCIWYIVIRKGCTLSPCLFNLYAEYIMINARLDEALAGIKITRRNINNLRYADDTTLMAESEEELKSL